jgi:Na+-translocating ferredoxin:NAD+ oxidoreductase RnfD subunit
MKLSPPKQVTWYVALVLAVLALVGQQKIVAGLTQYSFWLALIAAALLLVATMVEGL